jgi:phage terminase large subunit
MYTFNTTPVFEANYYATEDILVNQGGTDSSKTISILQTLCVIATTTKPPVDDDPIITVLAESVPNLKKGAWRKMESFFLSDPEFVKTIKNPDSLGDRVIHFRSGWKMEFISAVDEQSAKQGKRQYLYVNEANGIAWPIFWQMAKRTRIRTYIDYNPSAPFWAHDKLIGTLPETNDLSATVKLIISDHRHNPFLSEREHAKTEGIKDPQLWKVYARGLTGNLQGLIYPDWKMIPDKDFPWKADKFFGGIDFGYTNDPTAGVLMTRIGESIFVHELCYDNEFTEKQIAKLYNANKFGRSPLYCEHDGDMIRALRKEKLRAVPARKGPNSIKPGIKKVKDYQIFFTASSKNIEFERKRYMWMQDPVTGKFMNEPIDQDNHLMDAIRYGIFTHYYRSENK